MRTADSPQSHQLSVRAVTLSPNLIDVISVFNLNFSNSEFQYVFVCLICFVSFRDILLCTLIFLYLFV